MNTPAIFNKFLPGKISLLVVGALPAIALSCKEEPVSPNVIFILADDLGWSQTGAYGSNYYHTPHIDRLSAEGLRFTDAYSAAPVCSPTRASVMTGKYPARLRLTDFIPGNDRDIYPLTQPEWRKFLPLGEITLGDLFSTRGYQTAMFGKWHLSVTKFGPESWPLYPDKQGFHEFFVIDKPESTTDPEYDPHSSDSIGNRSVNFIREHAGKPFFLFMSFSAIHNPLVEKADSIAWWLNVAGSGKPENNHIIAPMLSRMDRNIGKVMDALDELKLAEKTIVVFYSDNGGLEKEAKQTPLNFGKGWLYEGGIRVPLIIRWPGVVAGETVSDAPVISCDFMPTFCELLEIDQPADIDGVSLLSHLKSGVALPERSLFWHYPHYHGSGMIPGGAIRKGKWKMIEWFEKSLLQDSVSAYELFNLETDIGEAFDRAGTDIAVKQEMVAELERWRREINAQMPVPNAAFSK